MCTGTIGCRVRSSQRTKATASKAPAASAAGICGLAQPMLLARISPPDQAERAGGGQHQAGQVQRRAVRAPRGGHPGQDQRRDHDRADRDVQPEDPRPGQALGHRAAHDRAGQHRDPGHAAEDAEGPGSSLWREAADSAARAIGSIRAAPAP